MQRSGCSAFPVDADAVLYRYVLSVSPESRNWIHRGTVRLGKEKKKVGTSRIDSDGLAGGFDNEFKGRDKARQGKARSCRFDEQE